MNLPEKVFYIPGALHLIDCARNVDGVWRSYCYGRTLEEVQAADPGAQLLDFAVASPMLDAAERAAFVRPPTRITAERFEEVLNVLPPVRWVRAGHEESFLMSEREAGSLTGIFCRIGEAFYNLTDECTLKHAEIVARCRASEGGAPPAV